jgi:hypothetical protein
MATKTLAGSWLTPLRVIFTGDDGDEGNSFTSENGDMKLTFDRGSRSVTLAVGDECLPGKVLFSIAVMGSVMHRMSSLRLACHVALAIWNCTEV